MPSFISPTTPLAPPPAPAPKAPLVPAVLLLATGLGEAVEDAPPDPPPGFDAAAAAAPTPAAAVAAAAAADSDSPPGGCGEDRETRPTHGSAGMNLLRSSGCCLGDVQRCVRLWVCLKEAQGRSEAESCGGRGGGGQDESGCCWRENNKKTSQAFLACDKPRGARVPTALHRSGAERHSSTAVAGNCCIYVANNRFP